MIKDATKAAKKVTKAADEALTTKKSNKHKPVKHKEPKDGDQTPDVARTKDDSKPKQAKAAQPEEEEGPPVPLTHQPAENRNRAQPGKPDQVESDTKPELKKEATPVHRLPPPPPQPSSTAGKAGAQPDWRASTDESSPAVAPEKNDALPQAEVIPLRRSKDLPEAKPDPAPIGKPLPVTMIPPKAADPAVTANTWPKEDIDAAKANCVTILKAIDAVTIAEAPIREGNCGAPAPVRLVSIGKNPEVALSPPPLVTCELVGGLFQWMKDEVQPLSKKHFGSPVIKIETMSDYSCRMAYGRKGNKLSEHGKANALDIRGFVTAKGEAAYVLEQWGKTDRDRKAEAAALAAQKEAAAKATTAAATAGSKTALEQEKAKAALSQASLIGSAEKTDPAQDGEDHDPGKAFAATIVPDEPRSKKSQFLHDVHDTACHIFGTSLGPESNEAHRNHFHVDMAERKRTKICE